MKLKTVVIIIAGIIILAAVGFAALLFYNRYRTNHLEEKQFNGETGLAWQIPGWTETFLAGNGDFVWHNGEAGGYNGFIAIDPGRKCGAILLSNTTDDITTTGMMLLPFVRQISFAEDNQKQ